MNPKLKSTNNLQMYCLVSRSYEIYTAAAVCERNSVCLPVVGYF